MAFNKVSQNEYFQFDQNLFLENEKCIWNLDPKPSRADGFELDLV
jgi:hypothetical protein